MEDHSSDILGGRLPVQRHHSPSLWPNTDSNGKLYLGFALVVFLSAWLWLKPYWYAWRNERYRIQVRRRHGIPDDDRRPFSVAFAAVNARKQRDAKEKESRESQEDGRPPSSSQARSPLDGQVQEEGPLDPYVPPLFHPQAYNKGPFEGAYREPNGLGAASTLSTNGHPEWSGSPVNGLNRATSTSENSRSFFVPGQLNTPGREDTSPILESSRRSHVREEALPDSEREAKKSRVQEEAPYEGDDTLETDEDMAVDQTPEAPRRGAKRAASPEYDEGLDNARYNRRDKRARKVSHETYHGDTDHSMDSDDDQLDDEMEADAPFRGRKRDRVEAGSSFGGDDSFLGEEDEKARRHRKRRTLGHRKAEPTSRGKKRSRAAESDESDGEQSDRPRKQASRRKRGKRSPGLVDEDDMDVDEISQDPLCKGRHVGEEWESHGTRFKVGLNGQRLRLELVKRSRTRFPMPKDSQHPDKEANIDIYVETWLTEDEYKSAKEKRELAWQAPTKREQVPHSLDIPESPMSPSKIGKGLLWMADASDVPESPLPQRGPFKQSTASNVGIRSNPFEQSTMTPIRRVSRISSVYQASAPASAPESPKLTASKSYSKWEKQDLEAAAMSRIREKLQREANKARVKEIPAAETKPAVETRSAFTAKTDAPTAPATGPTFSFAKPADKTEEKAAEKPSTPASNTFNAPKTTTPFSFPPAPAASSAPSEQTSLGCTSCSITFAILVW
ncbi:hypothetical protein CERSUDRAFT_111442 [Gelatoporia subvermispora B]|uniref:Uncharacterized protein n=1 Tax=Ceriporiopsis subvermispora (strain B) TaxID=914234 RepID=M2QUW6_CERS8|nr:hypothetical protein CERSUDRAFT_111442 [Gelatoporia subvermispora B]